LLSAVRTGLYGDSGALCPFFDVPADFDDFTGAFVAEDEGRRATEFGRRC